MFVATKCVYPASVTCVCILQVLLVCVSCKETGIDFHFHRSAPKWPQMVIVLLVLVRKNQLGMKHQHFYYLPKPKHGG